MRSAKELFCEILDGISNEASVEEIMAHFEALVEAQPGTPVTEEDRTCKLCQLLKTSADDPTRISVLPSGVAFVNFDQTYRGRSMIVASPHSDDLLHSPLPQLLNLMRDAKRLSEAVIRSFSPARLNYLMLGNTVRHLHLHIVPRYPDAPRWELSPLLPEPGKYKHQSEAFYSSVAQRIRSNLEREGA